VHHVRRTGNEISLFPYLKLLDHFGWPHDEEHIALVKWGVLDLKALLSGECLERKTPPSCSFERVDRYSKT
jgi:hypothetical protein